MDDLIRGGFIAILRYVACCGEEYGSESHWGQQRYHYSEIRYQACSYPYETRTTTVAPTTVSKPTSRTHGNELPAASSSSTTKVLSSLPPSVKFPPPPAAAAADKPTPTIITTSSCLSEVLRQPKSFGYSSSSPASYKASDEVSSKPTDSIFSHIRGRGGTNISGKLIEVSEGRKCFQYSSSSPIAQKAKPLSATTSQAKPRDLFSSSSVTPKQNEVTKMPAARSLSSSAMSAQVSEAAHAHSFNNIIKTNTTEENKSITLKCSHHLPSSSPSPQSSQNKLLLSNTARLPPPSPKPTPSLPSPFQKKPSLSTKPALRADSAKNHNAE